MRSLVVLVLAAGCGFAQTAFESATVKHLTASQAGNTVLSPQGADRFFANSVTLDVLIELAYGVNENQLSGQPSWITQERYDVTLKTKGAGGLSYEQLRPALQEMLARKFDLKIHRETKMYEGFALVVDAAGSKLKETNGEAGKKYVMPEGIYFQNTSLATFAAALAIPMHKPVIDKTGLTGKYDIRLDYAKDGSPNSAYPPLKAALPAQLGLRLEAQKVPIELLVIEGVDRDPVN